MKTLIKRLLFGVLILGALRFTSHEAHARLPKPIQTEGVILAVDADTQSLVFKAGNHEKPFALDWNKQTQFFKGDEPIDAATLKPADNVVIHYRRVSFRNPLLKKVLLHATEQSR